MLNKTCVCFSFVVFLPLFCVRFPSPKFVRLFFIFFESFVVFTSLSNIAEKDGDGDRISLFPRIINKQEMCFYTVVATPNPYACGVAPYSSSVYSMKSPDYSDKATVLLRSINIHFWCRGARAINKIKKKYLFCALLWFPCGMALIMRFECRDYSQVSRRILKTPRLFLLFSSFFFFL